MEIQILRQLKRIMVPILCLTSINSYSLIYSSLGTENSQPNTNVLELQLSQNSVLLFGTVDSVMIKKQNQQDQDVKEGAFNLSGFRNYILTLKIDQVWSKDAIKTLPKYYKVEFGAMTDDRNPDSLPVRQNEDLVIVLEQFRPNSVHLLKDHLLNIYEHKIDIENDKRHFFVSKLMSGYDQKNLELSDLYRVAYTEQMRVYDHNFLNSKDTKASRSIASLSNQKGSEELPYTTIKPGSLKDPTRDPNSVLVKNKDEELSAFSLLLIFIFLATFSHFLIKHYENEEEI